MPGFGGAACVSGHVFAFVDAVVGQGGDGVIRAGIDADDRAVAQVVVVVDDGFEQLRIILPSGRRCQPACSYPQVSRGGFAMRAPSRRSASREKPRQMTVVPGGASEARSR